MSELAQVALAIASEAKSKVEYLERELDRARNSIEELSKKVHEMVGASLTDQFQDFRKLHEEDARKHSAEMAALKARIDTLNQKKSPRGM